MKSDALNKLYDKYYPKSWPGARTFEELKQWVTENLDVAELPWTSFPPHFRQRIVYNMENCCAAQAAGLTPEQFRFVAYRLLKTERTASYYEENYADKGQPDACIYLILEEHLGLAESNHSRLVLETRLAAGISQQDYETKSIFMDVYVTDLYFMDQHWY